CGFGQALGGQADWRERADGFPRRRVIVIFSVTRPMLLPFLAIQIASICRTKRRLTWFAPTRRRLHAQTSPGQADSIPPRQTFPSSMGTTAATQLSSSPPDVAGRSMSPASARFRVNDNIRFLLTVVPLTSNPFCRQSFGSRIRRVPREHVQASIGVN